LLSTNVANTALKGSHHLKKQGDAALAAPPEAHPSGVREKEIET